MAGFFNDLRFAYRSLKRSPGFVAVSVLSLALGIGANVSIFSVIYAVLLQPLPYPQSEALVTFGSNESGPNLADIQRNAKSFQNLGGITLQALDYTGTGEPVQLLAGLVTGGYFKTLSTAPLIGRYLTESDDQAGAARNVVLSFDLWQQRFASDPAVIGRSIILSGYSYTIVGVMPRGFRSPREEPELWAALMVVNPNAGAYRGVHFLRTYARLNPGVTSSAATAEMKILDQKLAKMYPQENADRDSKIIDLKERIAGNSRPALFTLYGAVGLVLLIASANYAGLMIARSISRESEIAMRAAMGAPRARIIFQVLTEAIMISILAGVAGIALSYICIEVLIRFKPENLPLLNPVRMNSTVLGYSIAISTLTGLLAGMIPAWQSTKVNLTDCLKEMSRSSTAGKHKNVLRRLIVSIEIALALVLLVGAGLLIKSIWRLNRVDPGFDPNNLITMRIELPEARYKEIPKQSRYRASLLDSIQSLPGVEAGMVSELPLSGEWIYHTFVIEGQNPDPSGNEQEVQTRSVGGNYFQTMKIRILSGRGLNTNDRENTELVGVINESMARKYFPGKNPIGQRVRWLLLEGPPQWVRIVGISKDIKHFGLDQMDDPAVYTPYAQSSQEWKRWMFLVVRTTSRKSAIIDTIKKEIWKLDPSIPITRIRMMEDVVSVSYSARKFNALLLGIFSGVALILSLVGIFALISFSVNTRIRELGIRMALGATKAKVFQLIVGDGLKLASGGLIAGVIASYFLTRLMSSLLFEVKPADPFTLFCVAIFLLVACFFASSIPARKASTIEPSIALRQE